jgi:hypothetical protein
MHQRHGALTVYLVACVKKKQHGPAAAKHLYVSVWFKNACHYAEASHCPWFIVSAKHGLLAPDEILMSYEKTLNTMAITARKEWAMHVLAQLYKAVPHIRRVVFLAGERYREFLADELRNRHILVSVPMRGLAIGKQLSWLKRRVSAIAVDRK